MDFTEALQAKTREERHRLITEQVEGEDWLDEIEEKMTEGGWPADSSIESIKITDDDSGPIRVSVDVSYTETQSTGCANVNLETGCSVLFQVVIDRATGEFEVESDHYSNDDDEDEVEVYVDDYA